jgi:hypothetical protein
MDEALQGQSKFHLDSGNSPKSPPMSEPATPQFHSMCEQIQSCHFLGELEYSNHELDNQYNLNNSSAHGKFDQLAIHRRRF